MNTSKKISGKKAGKFCLVGLCVIAAGVGIYKLVKWAYNDVKAGKKQLDDASKNMDDVMSASGITDKVIDEQINEAEKGNDNRDLNEMDINFPKKTFTELFFDNDSDGYREESLHFRRARREKSERVVHVQQRFDRKVKRWVLDFIFEIPIGSEVNSGGQKAKYHDRPYSYRTFIDSIKGYKEKDPETGAEVYIEGDVLKDIKAIAKENQGEFAIKNGKLFLGCDILARHFVRYDKYYQSDEIDPETGKKQKLFPCSGYFDVTKRELADNNYTSEISYVTDLKYRYKKDGASKKEVAEGLSEIYDFEEKGMYNVEVIDTTINIRITFALQRDGHIDGLSVKGATEICKYILDEMYIEADLPEVNNDFTYQYIMFHSYYLHGEEEKVYGPELTNINRRKVMACVLYPQEQEDVEQMIEDEKIEYLGKEVYDHLTRYETGGE